MRKKYTRVVLYFPDDHFIAQLPMDNRNKMAKDLVEKALSQENALIKIQSQLEEIKDFLCNISAGKLDIKEGNNTKLSNDDIALIDQILGHKN